MVDCVNKLQHWAENCPYSQVRESLSIFLRSLSEVSPCRCFPNTFRSFPIGEISMNSDYAIPSLVGAFEMKR